MLAFYFYSLILFANAQKRAVNHSDAERLCNNKGGLASSSLFPRVNVTLANYEQPRGNVRHSQLKNVDLEDGESAWVAGYARYGEFWNHWGCYPYDPQHTFASSGQQEHRGLYGCSKYCEMRAHKTSLSGTYYLSINTISCFCLKTVLPEKRISCPYNTDKGLAELELYKKRNRYPSYGQYQCSVIAHSVNSDSSKWDETTSKCLGNKNIVCYNTFISKLICKNITLSNSLYCDADYSSIWINGVNKCNSLQGTMVPHLSHELEVTRIIGMDKQYWMGAVSAYTIHSEPGDACLAVTRTGDQLVLEPDDCGAENSFICAADIMINIDDKYVKPTSHTNSPISKQTTTSTVTPTSQRTHITTRTRNSIVRPVSTGSPVKTTEATVTPNSLSTQNSSVKPRFTGSPVKTTEATVPITSPASSASGNSTIVIVVVCCSVLVGVAMAIVICKYKKKANTESRKKLIAQPMSDVSDSIVANAADCHYATVNDNVMIQTNSGVASKSSDTLSRTTVIDDTKPENHIANTPRRKTNYELQDDTLGVRGTLDNTNTNCKDTKGSISDDYHVLSYNQPAQRPRPQNESEIHVYDHVSAITNVYINGDKSKHASHDCQNEYDTTESVKVLLQGDYATAQSLQHAVQGDYDTSQPVTNVRRKKYQPDNIYSHITHNCSKPQTTNED